MGINFSHCRASWSYSGFNFFRGWLAEMCGFEWPIGLDDSIATEPLWDKIRNSNDGIRHLLYHSDCDGELTVEQLREVIPRLKALMNHYKDSSLSHRVDYDYEQAMELLRGMETAVEANEPLVFC